MSLHDDVKALHKAMKGLGTDDSTLVDIITSRNNIDLSVHIAKEYQAQHGRTLIKDIEGDTSGDYRDILVGLCTYRPKYIAHYIKKAVAGLGTDEKSLIDVLAYATNAELTEAAKIYQEDHKKSMLQDVMDDTSGNFKQALKYILEHKRSENNVVDPHSAMHHSKELYEKGEGRMGTNDDFFIHFFTHHSHPHIAEVNRLYREQRGHDLAKAVEKEASGDFKDLLHAIALGREHFWATRIHHAIKGLGTNDALLKRAFILNDKNQLKAIAHVYHQMYLHHLEGDIKGDTSGNFQKVLLGLLH